MCKDFKKLGKVLFSTKEFQAVLTHVVAWIDMGAEMKDFPLFRLTSTSTDL